jgi:hypothetical protein
VITPARWVAYFAHDHGGVCGVLMIASCARKCAD